MTPAPPLPIYVQIASTKRTPHYLAVEVDRGKINVHCDLSNAEIVGFAVRSALDPWINILGRPTNAGEPSPQDVKSAIESFSADGPTMSARFGCLQATPIPGPITDRWYGYAPRFMTIAMPNGEQNIAGNYLQSLRDHWQAHRQGQPQQSGTEFSLPRARQALKLMTALIVCAAEERINMRQDVAFDPEFLVLATRPFSPDADLSSWIKSRQEMYAINLAAERWLMGAGLVREDPTTPGGVRWRAGPKWSEATHLFPDHVRRYSAGIYQAISDINAPALNAVRFKFARGFGDLYLRQILDDIGSQPSSHAHMAAAKHWKAFETWNDAQVTVPLRRWFATTNR